MINKLCIKKKVNCNEPQRRPSSRQTSRRWRCSRRNTEDLENHINIADWLFRWKTQPPCEPVKKHCVAFLKAAKFSDPEYHEQLEALIEEFDLELWRVERIEKEAAQEPP